MQHTRLDYLVPALGVVALAAWIVDAVHIFLTGGQPSTLLWYSLAGLLLTGVALIWQNNLLLSSAFCALFIPEAIWSIGFLSNVVLSKDIGIAGYMTFSSLTSHDTFISLYHLLMPIGLGFGMLRQKIIDGYSWAGAILFGSFVIGLTYLLVPHTQDVNCLWQVGLCRNFISHNYFGFGPGSRTLLTIAGLTMFVYLPTYAVTRMVVQHKADQQSATLA